MVLSAEPLCLCYLSRWPKKEDKSVARLHLSPLDWLHLIPQIISLKATTQMENFGCSAFLMDDSEV